MQAAIIADLHVVSTIDATVEFRRRVDFVKNYVRSHSFLRAMVLGISGGQDSTLTGLICQTAASECRREGLDLKLIAVRLPYGIQFDENDCQAALEYIKPDEIVTVNIKPAVDASEASLLQAGIRTTDFVRGNDKARERMKAQYAIAGVRQGLVVGTDHAAEAVTGFFTKFGDGGVDINPITGLTKRQGRAILESMNCPKYLYTKVPTADLENDKPALPDEVALGITYNTIDDYLEGKQVNADDAAKIESLYRKSAHKRTTPVTPFD